MSAIVVPRSGVCRAQAGRAGAGKRSGSAPLDDDRQRLRPLGRDRALRGRWRAHDREIGLGVLHEIGKLVVQIVRVHRHDGSRPAG